jgi:phospholipid/cholesterol/gamma-HCH transport system substrate-binding protein
MAEQNDTVAPMPASRGQHREAWVGLFVIVGVLTGLATLLTLTNAAMFRGRYVLITDVEDASGIRKGDPVVLRGVNIGRIQSFKIGPGGVAIRLEIEGEYTVPVGSHVELRQNSILGSVFADVIPGTSTEMLRGGQTLPGSRPGGLYDSMAALKDDARAVLKQAQAALSPETVQNIQSSSSEMQQLLKELTAMATEQRKELGDLSRSLKRSAHDIEGLAGRPELDRAIKRLDTMTTHLDESTASLKRSSNSLETVMARIENGEGTLGKLSKDDTLYKNLNETVASMSRLAEDIRRQPKKYLHLSLF